MTLKPWREVAVPHEDVLRGTFQQAEFAADITRVHSGTAVPEYQNPKLFFERTYITEGMGLLLNSVVRRLGGLGGDPVIQLQTAFGGGKTHSMLAVYHLASGRAPARDLAGVGSILDKASVTELPSARIAVIDGINLSPSQPKVRDGLEVKTFLGEIAWQLGGRDAYQRIAAADADGTAPPKEVVAEILNAASPCVILMDELVAYFRQFGDKRLAAGTFDTNITIVQVLTEAMKAAPRAILMASLPDSHNAGGDEGQRALRELENYFGRVQAIWKPVGEEEAFEIVRRRLFSGVSDERAKEEVCRAFAALYRDNPNDFPQETQAEQYLRRVERAYPIHPEIFERLYKDWSSLPNFQRTRGVLKLMARVIHRLWQDNNRDLLILPGSLPLADTNTANELLAYLSQGWQPVIDRDVDGPSAAATVIDTGEPLFGSVEAARRCSRTIMLGSAPTSANRHVQGIALERVTLGAAQPEQPVARFKDATRRLQDKLSYLSTAEQRFWFDVRPNLRKEMEERKHRFEDVEHVQPEIKTRLTQMFGAGVFGGTHVFVASQDVPDDQALRLVVLPLSAAYSRTTPDLALKAADAVLRTRGEQPRIRQNRLVFLAADADASQRLRDHVRTMLAWQSIISDYQGNRLVLDNIQAKQASEALEQAREQTKRTLRETFRWLLVPRQDVKNGRLLPNVEWDTLPVSAQAPNLSAEIDKVLRENELLIHEWAPIHLSNLLRLWFWKPEQADVGALDVWQKSCCYLYMPRLTEEEVYRRAVAAGAPSTDFFGLAYGKEDGQYKGLSFGNATTPILDGSLLLIDPARVPAPEPTPPPGPGTDDDGVDPSPTPKPKPVEPSPDPEPQPVGAQAKMYYGSVALPPLTAVKDFMSVYDEIVQLFTQRHDATVTITVDIRAETTGGFDEALQRSVRENARVLKFTASEFTDE